MRSITMMSAAPSHQERSGPMLRDARKRLASVRSVSGTVVTYAQKRIPVLGQLSRGMPAHSGTTTCAS
jgi:hypothetical protein